MCHAKNSKNPICSFIRKLISPYGYGSKDDFGYRRPTNKALVNDYNRRSYIRGLTNAQMCDHFDGESTFYFWADGRIKTHKSLICINIYNNNFVSLNAALAFAKHLRDRFFPDLYFEPSTGGKGVHGYVIIDKRGSATSGSTASARCSTGHSRRSTGDGRPKIRIKSSRELRSRVIRPGSLGPGTAR
ncbi:hypothetical protein Sinac_6044 [Singulisphaera acidiphila DSM 18658]|uniref:Uncharacterized protein n=1 Tax=Singulisphaera acidiphila (strain ATCC BAA-1392 / DSM 18658 / VKM B-2454 / MOB10) TaxID=886293 RepID=L0DMT6_SINAD|nr:hypothetical protein Sinac_6044 [Singulisphaera acidiphila DSM 18658]